MQPSSLASYSDQELFDTLKKFRGTECRVIADIVLYLAEVDARKIYRDFAFSSLFVFCTKGLGYSEGAAQRRIVAARCCRDNPEVYTLLREGKVSLCALSEVAKVLTPENKVELLNLSQGLPKQEAQRLAAKFQAPTQPKREVMRAKKVVVSKAEQGSQQLQVLGGSTATSTVPTAPEPTATVANATYCLR